MCREILHQVCITLSVGRLPFKTFLQTRDPNFEFAPNLRQIAKIVFCQSDIFLIYYNKKCEIISFLETVL
jgi:hypothetical protein